jgi:hypothetical protein
MAGSARIERLRLVEVPEYVPNGLEPGALYVSERFRLAIHVCPCGCGAEAVTPLGAEGWTLTRDPEGPTLAPSILNRGCRAHYYVRNGAIEMC